MAKKPRPEGKKYNFMDTYGDMMTLLMCFFVLLFAMSTIDESKYNAFVQGLSNRFGPATYYSMVPPDASVDPGSAPGETDPTGETQIDPAETLPADFAELRDNVSQYIETNGMEGEISVEVGESGAIFIRVSDNVLFDGDSYLLKAEAQEFLRYLGAGLVDIQDNIFQVRLMGHTAMIEGSGKDDWLLGNERSGMVASFLERQVGFSPVLMQASGHGRLFPIADNATPEGLAKNRRVDMVIISNNADNLAEALLEAARIYFPSDSTEFYQGDPDQLPQHTIDQVPPVGPADVDLANLSDEQMRELYDIMSEIA